MQKDLQKFLQGPLARKALSGLARSAVIRIEVDGVPYRCIFASGTPILIEEGGREADLDFWISNKTISAVLAHTESTGADLASLGVFLFERIFAQGDARIGFRINATLFTLARRGYFSVIVAGGPMVMKYLASKGFGSLNKIRSALTR